MSGDAYGRLARLQDAVLEPLNAPSRDIAVAMVAPRAGLRVLDVGCGTGKQLERFVAAGCVVAGVDKSPAMLSRARETLGESVDLRLADAQSLPFPDASFGLVAATLVLHELTPDARTKVAREMLRVLAPDGSMQLASSMSAHFKGSRAG